VQVARLANNRWAVSARGFNGRFANKLLVLMDGRSIYSPLFSGVLWEAEDTLLEDIDRIEVIRGPGAALWGANAVNGVINIITRHARDTRGTLVTGGAGTEERGFVALRHGLAVAGGDLRLWAKAFDRDASEDLAGHDGNDDWRAWRMGLRGDWALGNTRRLTVSAMGHAGSTGDRWNLPSLFSPSGALATDLDQKNHGGHVLARHTWLGADGSEGVLQAYVEQSVIDVPGYIREQRTTADLDFQHRLNLGASNDVVWGLNLRQSRDRITTGPADLIRVSPERRTWRLASLFVQDEVTLVPERWRLVLGTKLEHNNWTGFEPQPNVRLAFTPSDTQTWWAALSRAVHTPSRADLDLSIDLKVVPGDPATRRPPGAAAQPAAGRAGRARRTREYLRGRPAPAVRCRPVDRRRRLLQPLCQAARRPPGGAGLPVRAAAACGAGRQPCRYRRRQGAGVELAADWRVSRSWRLQPTYTYLSMQGRPVDGDAASAGALADIEGRTPRHQFGLRSSHNWGRVRLDAWLRHVGTLPGAAGSVARVAAYETLDLRLAWRAAPGLELSLVGQNLLQSRHGSSSPTTCRRSCAASSAPST
jgi:iron complex outermembrane recepter protein